MITSGSRGSNVMNHNDILTKIFKVTLYKRDTIHKGKTMNNFNNNSTYIKSISNALSAGITTNVKEKTTPSVVSQELNDMLVAAAGEGNIKQVSRLIEHGADVNVRSTYDYLALQEAIEKGDYDIVKLLIKHGAKVNASGHSERTALIGASSSYEINIVKLLIKHGAKVNEKDGDGYTALMLAVINERSNIARFLIKHGADVHAKNRYGDTILTKAVEKQSMDLVKLLIEHGAKK